MKTLSKIQIVLISSTLLLTFASINVSAHGFPITSPIKNHQVPVTPANKADKHEKYHAVKKQENKEQRNDHENKFFRNFSNKKFSFNFLKHRGK